MSMFGILGNNARNLLYIKKFNDKKAIRLANNKLETKNFLSERGIPFAKTYGIISHRNELHDFDFSYLPKKNFVIKPNQGSKGNGVYITKYLEDQTFEIQGAELSEKELKRQLLDILDGKYSLNAGDDKILIEEKLIPGELFKEFCEYGLADIRVIVFNLVPVATMIRIPTKDSGGKANLAQGGLGFGIEVGSGKITSLLYKEKIYTKQFPSEYQHFFGKKIPYRNDILFLSSKVQYFVNLGYLALDWVITNDGPKLLEINARAGLEVQKVSDTRLGKVLEKISDLKVTDPEKGVEIAKTLFTKEHSNLIRNNKVLYLSQYGKLSIKDNQEDKEQEKIPLTIEVNIEKNSNGISQHLYEKLKENKSDYIIELPDNDILFKNLKCSPIESNENKLILGKKTAEDFLIKPLHKTFEIINILKEDEIFGGEQEELHTIDTQVENLNRRLNLSAKLKPINYFNELDKFISNHGKYNPTFSYKRPSQEHLTIYEDKLKKLQDKTNKLESHMKNLFLEKEDELYNKLKLIKAYSKQDFSNIETYNKSLFGSFDEELLRIAKEKVFSQKENNQELLGEPLKLSAIEHLIESYLAQKKIYGVDIVFSYDNLSRISVIMGKEIRISISKHGIFREKEILSILAHEIDTHLMRHLNGIKSGWNIFKSGTGYYLKDEEGLAIYNANKILPEEYEKESIYKKYYLTKEAEKLDFKKLSELIKFLDPEKNLERCFKGVLRIKKGSIDTSGKQSINFIKDKIYLEGLKKIEENIQEGIVIEKLYKGKVKIEDLDLIQ